MKEIAVTHRSDLIYCLPVGGYQWQLSRLSVYVRRLHSARSMTRDRVCHSRRMHATTVGVFVGDSRGRPRSRRSFGWMSFQVPLPDDRLSFHRCGADVSPPRRTASMGHTQRPAQCVRTVRVRVL